MAIYRVVSMVLYFQKYLGLFFTCFVTSPARTDIFRPGGVKNAVSEKQGAWKWQDILQGPSKRR